MNFEHCASDSRLYGIVPGEQVALVGNNGAGKTRMIEAFCREHPFDTEYIAFKDTYGDDADGAYYLQLRWNTQELANLIELDDSSKDMFSLSSGELRKRRIARALKSRATYLIIDNPYLGLDVRSRGDFTEMLAQIAAEGGRSIILVMPGDAIMPSFITRIIRVGDDAQIRDLPEECRAAIASFPQKDLSAVRFYPSCENAEIVKCNGVSIRYGERTILKSLDWTVHEGECWAVRGENGSGKSTLLSLVCADNPQAYACDIELFGHKRGSGESIWDIKSHIGFVSPELHRAYNHDVPVIDVVASGLHDKKGLYMRTTPEQVPVCLHWLDVFGIGHLAERHYLHLSSGEQRLVLLARAFVKDPELLILDEPLHGLDDANSAHVKQVIETFCSHPDKTLIMVSHYEEEFPPCIDHRLRLSN